MQWEKGRESDNVVRDVDVDRNVDGDESSFNLPRGSYLPVRAPHLGLGGIVFIIVISLFFGVNPLQLLSAIYGLSSNINPSQVQLPYADDSASEIQVSGTEESPQVKFVRTILGSTEDVWSAYFQELGSSYQFPKLKLFSGHTRSGCGLASESMGPFYCTSDARVYLDLSFFQELENRFHAGGDFARAYVIAHEIGHHVQSLIGSTEYVARERRRGGSMEGEDGLSVRLELQADCLAGVWAHRAEKQLHWLEAGDIEAALNAANQIGDDTLQRQAQGFAVPDSFTHGTSAQRIKWFKTGFQSGDLNQCNTF